MVEYSCFISYRNGVGDDFAGFVVDFEQALTELLEPLVAELPPFRDKQRLTAGDRFQPKLGEAVCRSVCLVSILTPSYFESPYCRRELAAMLQLEQERWRNLGNVAPDHSYVIPVHFCGPRADFPSVIKDHVLFADFTQCHLWNRPHGLLRDPTFGPEVQKIATTIYARYQELKAHRQLVLRECAGFELPSDPEHLRMTYCPPMPLRGREAS